MDTNKINRALKKRRDRLRETPKWAAQSNVGLMFPTSIAVGAFFGYYLDKWLGTSPYMFLIFVFYGIAAGFVNLIKSTRIKKDKEEDQNDTKQ